MAEKAFQEQTAAQVDESIYGPWWEERAGWFGWRVKYIYAQFPNI